MSRKAFVATDAMREMVRKLASRGVPQDDIAKIVDCAPKTLRKHFRDELDRGAAAANAEMCRLLFAAAERGNIAAIIFWLKTRGRWRETKETEGSTPTSGEKSPQYVVVLLDNGRDREEED
jgi:hypothetical protein